MGRGEGAGLPALSIVFSVGLSVLFSKIHPLAISKVLQRHRSVTVARYPVRFVTFVTLFSEKNKLNRLPLENIICPAH